MKDYQHEFLRFAIEYDVLCFGEFILKSGRTSPYFFNTALFNTGLALARLGRFYARALVDADVEFDVLFGPAYKGIPLVSTTAIALADHHGVNRPWCFNRKEVKSYGEGGRLIGAPLKGRIAILDDVISAGTAIGEAMGIIEQAGAKPSVVLIALDRQERGQGELSAIQQVREDFNVPVASIVNLCQMLDFVQEDKKLQQYAGAIETYGNQYGSND
ncbi:MAG: orotate phosphoribosyltransferase [Endozoicomonadaceae bacterium]|nr:orotate phosphoribosyltransferase [Endozoicomonadaceae bacterium]